MNYVIKKLLAKYFKPPIKAYDQDGLKSIHNHEFMNDAQFMSAYKRGIQAADKDYNWHWRVHIGLWAASIGAKLQGDFVECGVNAGFMSSAIMHHLNWNALDKNFYLLDTFSGIDPSQVTEAEKVEGILDKNRLLQLSGFYVQNVASVQSNFSEWPRAHIIAGSIPHSLSQVKSKKLAFLHIDLNCTLPEVASLEFFWDRLSLGAPVLLDDYAYNGYHQQKYAMDALSKRLDAPIASLPTGQGLLFKS